MVFVTQYDTRSGSLLPWGHISRKRPLAPEREENVQMIQHRNRIAVPHSRDHRSGHQTSELAPEIHSQRPLNVCRTDIEARVETGLPQLLVWKGNVITEVIDSVCIDQFRYLAALLITCRIRTLYAVWPAARTVVSIRSEELAASRSHVWNIWFCVPAFVMPTEKWYNPEPSNSFRSVQSWFLLPMWSKVKSWCI